MFEIIVITCLALIVIKMYSEIVTTFLMCCLIFLLACFAIPLSIVIDCMRFLFRLIWWSSLTVTSCLYFLCDLIILNRLKSWRGDCDNTIADFSQADDWSLPTECAQDADCTCVFCDTSEVKT